MAINTIEGWSGLGYSAREKRMLTNLNDRLMSVEEHIDAMRREHDRMKEEARRVQNVEKTEEKQ